MDGNLSDSFEKNGSERERLGGGGGVQEVPAGKRTVLKMENSKQFKSTYAPRHICQQYFPQCMGSGTKSVQSLRPT